MLHQARQTLEKQDTQAPWDQGCSRAAPGNRNAGEAGEASRIKPYKPSGTEKDLEVSPEEETQKAPRRYGENSNRY